jgi:acetyl-CoA C-acetyltransferase
MYITGVGKTKFGQLNEPLSDLAYSAITRCLNDANKEIEDIDAIFVANFMGGVQASQLHISSMVSSFFKDFHKPCMRVEAACASGGMAVFNAIRMSGHFNNILVVGVEKMTNLDPKATSKNIAMAGDVQLDQQNGVIFPASYALIAQQHMMKYGTTIDDLTLVSLKNHNNALLNPYAHFSHKKVTREMIESSPIVSSPLRLFDCSPISDGAAAIILSNKSDTHKIKIAGSGAASDTISLMQRKDLTTFTATKEAARQAYKQSGLTMKDIDLAQVHDCFTIAELVAMEDLGICKPGESKDWVRKGMTELNGIKPVNVDGGLKGGGHPIGATGVSQMIEITLQLRGEAKKRQLDKAKAGIAQNIGGVGGTAAVHILRRE